MDLAAVSNAQGAQNIGAPINSMVRLCRAPYTDGKLTTQAHHARCSELLGSRSKQKI